jgi:hypothetical protein
VRAGKRERVRWRRRGGSIVVVALVEIRSPIVAVTKSLGEAAHLGAYIIVPSP